MGRLKGGEKADWLRNSRPELNLVVSALGSSLAHKPQIKGDSLELMEIIKKKKK